MAVKGRFRRHIRLDPPVLYIGGRHARGTRPPAGAGAPDITRIGPNIKSGDDIPAVLTGLQDPRGGEAARKRLSGLPDRIP